MIVAPSSRYLNNASTGTRLFRNRQAPLNQSGWRVTASHSSQMADHPPQACSRKAQQSSPWAGVSMLE